MGMFDRITTERPCQQCGRTLNDFQSKSGPCALLNLTPEQLFAEGGSGSDFYTSCPRCGCWNEWTFAFSSRIDDVRVIPAESDRA